MQPSETPQYTPEELAKQVSNNAELLKIFQAAPPRKARVQTSDFDYAPLDDVTNFLTSEFANNSVDQWFRRVNSSMFKILDRRLKDLLAQSNTTRSFQKYMMFIFLGLYVKGKFTLNPSNKMQSEEEQMVIIATDMQQENSPGIFGNAAKDIEKEIYLMLKEDLDQLELELESKRQHKKLDSRYYVGESIASEKRKQLSKWRKDFKALHGEEPPK